MKNHTRIALRVGTELLAGPRARVIKSRNRDKGPGLVDSS